MSSHALQQDGGRLFEGDTNRNRYDPFGRCHRVLRVGPENAAPCDPVTFMEVGDAFADRNHCSCSFLSRSERKLIAITTLPHVEVDEIYPGHSNATQYLVLLGCGRGNLPQVHDLGTTSFRKLNRLHRDRLLWAIPTARRGRSDQPSGIACCSSKQDSRFLRSTATRACDPSGAALRYWTGHEVGCPSSRAARNGQY